MSLADATFEGRQIVFAQDTFGSLNIALEPVMLLVVGHEMLGGRHDLQIVGIIPLQTAYIGGTQYTAQVRILSVGFGCTSPS